ncbi:MAG: hypothetical protein PWP58_715 [Bacillota bacterium]|jgi:uncharacterized alkaline shock family protein YloU|nr:hypothetical protein [Bacillota bacterium]
MGPGDRFLVFLASLFLMFFAAVIALSAGGALHSFPADVWVFSLYGYDGWKAWAIAVLVFLLGLRLAFLALPRKRAEHLLLQNSELGEVSIALTAIENLVQRTAGQVEGVKEVRSKVNTQAEGLSINLNAWVGSNVNVPDLATRLQEAVRQRLQQVVGLKAVAVKVAVKDIGGEPRLKVR